MKSLIKTMIRMKSPEKSIDIKHSAMTFKEYFYFHNTNQGMNSEFEINNILGNLKNEISLTSFSISELFINNPKLTIYLNEIQFSQLFSSFKLKLLNDLDNRRLQNWLSLNVQSNYQSTIERLKIHIKNQFEKLISGSIIWVNTFYEDCIFKYALIDYDSHKLCINKLSKFKYSLCNNLIHKSHFNGINISFSENPVTINYQTIFQLYPKDYSFLPYTLREEFIIELKKRIKEQSRINLSNNIYKWKIENLVNFYELLLSELEKLPQPKQFKLREAKDTMNKFKSICKYFIKKHKLFNCSIEDLSDIVTSESNLGNKFNISKEKESVFYLFIDILIQECISGATYSVIRDRFLLENTVVNLSDNAIANRKRNKLKIFSSRERKLIKNQALQLS